MVDDIRKAQNREVCFVCQSALGKVKIGILSKRMKNTETMKISIYLIILKKVARNLNFLYLVKGKE